MFNFFFAGTDCSLSHGITSSLQHFKKPWAHDHEPIRALLDAVKVWKFHLRLQFYKKIQVNVCVVFSLFFPNFSVYQADSVDRIIWSRENIYQGGGWGHDILQQGSISFYHRYTHTIQPKHMKLTCIVWLACRNLWFLHSPTQPHNLSVLLKKLIHGAR